MEFKMFSILKHLSQIHLSIIQQEEKKKQKNKHFPATSPDSVASVLSFDSGAHLGGTK